MKFEIQRWYWHI